MITTFTFLLILLSLLDDGAPLSDHRSHKRDSNNKKLCSNGNSCFLGSENKAAASEGIKHCRTSSDCAKGEYCHEFHRLCLRPQEQVIVAPMKTSAKKCEKNSNCKSREYCHEMWKICLPSRKVFGSLPTKRPAWYCESANDCRVDQLCHARFHACYTRPRVPAVRRSTLISRRCALQSECGPNFYCHDHFRICLPRSAPVKLERKWKSKTCASNAECQNGLMCHAMWKICFTPAQNFVGKENPARQCQHDSDCKENEFCHVMGRKVMMAAIARHRRNIESICLPLSFRPPQKASRNSMCKTNDECGPNKCCLEKLGVCLAYKLPGEMCLEEETDFVCSCAVGSFCRARGKLASPKRIINKMKLPEVAADHLMLSTHKRKYKIGKCIPEPSN